MPDLAAPAPPPAACRGAIERGVRRHRITERALGGWSTELIAEAEDPTPRRIGRTAARRRAPRGLQFACNPLILLDRPKNQFPDISRSKGFVGRRGPGRRPAPRVGRRRAADPRGLQFACNPLICLDRARNPFPNVATTKGFVGRRGPGRRPARRAGRRRATDPRAGFNLPATL